MIYALVVGISTYTVVPALNGALDAYDVEELLKAKFGEGVDVKLLVNRSAKYDKVIAAFDHLKQAGPEDQAFFYFSGHGSRIKSAPEFQHLSSDGMDETLLCFDSRKDGGLEISDKELAFLFSQVSERCPHVVGFFDCCHSGSLLRGRVKEAPPIHRARPISSYHGNWTPGRDNDLPKRKALLLTACNKWQYAEENTLEGRGNFTLAIRAVLERDHEISYQELHLQSRGAILRYSKHQTPQLESYGGFSPHTVFLRKQIAQHDFRFALSHEEARAGDGFSGGWYLNLGIWHGLPLSPETLGDIQIQDEAGHAVGVARLQAAGLEKSPVDIGQIQLDPAQSYSITFPDWVLDPMPIPVQGPEGIPEQLAQDWRASGFPLVRLFAESVSAKYELRVEGPDHELWQMERRECVFSSRDWEQMRAFIVRVYKWERLAQLRTVQMGKSHGNMFALLKVGNKENKKDWEGSETTVDLEKETPYEVAEIRLLNNAKGMWFWYLLELGSDYSIRLKEMDSFDGPSEWVRASRFGMAIDADSMAPSNSNHLQLLVSKTELDVGAFVQDKVHKSFGATREIGRPIELKAWNALPFSFHTLRVLGEIGNAPLSLAEGTLEIMPHASFRGNVGLRSSRPLIGPQVFAEFLGRTPASLLSLHTGALWHYNVLELSQLAGLSSLETEALELRLRIPQTGADVWPLALGSSGLYVPGKRAVWQGNVARIFIHKLEAGDSLHRPLTSLPSLQLCFFKTPSNSVDFEGMDSRSLETALLST